MKWLGRPSPFHMFTNPYVIIRCIFGQGVLFTMYSSYILNKKKKHKIHFSIYFSKSTLFSVITRYVFYVTVIRMFFYFILLPKGYPTYTECTKSDCKRQVRMRKSFILLGCARTITTNETPIEHDQILQSVSRINFLRLISCFH